jgi:hypothetical protein
VRTTLLPSQLCIPIDRLQGFELKREFCNAPVAVTHLPLK